MKYDIKKHKDEIITGIIKNLVWVPIAALIPIGNRLLNILLINYFTGSQNYKFQDLVSLFCFILSVSAIIFCIILYKKIIKAPMQEESSDETEKVESEKPTISSDFRFSSIVAELTFDDDRKNITSTIDYKMTVLTGSLTELERQLIWTGTEYKGTRLVQMNGDYELVDSTRTSSPYTYKIVFNAEKKRGDIVEFKTETSVVDGKLEMIPMYSFMAKYQIDKLVLRIIAPKRMIKDVTHSVYADTAKGICVEKPQSIPAENIRNLVRYTYEIVNPSLLYNYFIEWKFTN